MDQFAPWALGLAWLSPRTSYKMPVVSDCVRSSNKEIYLISIHPLSVSLEQVPIDIVQVYPRHVTYPLQGFQTETEPPSLKAQMRDLKLVSAKETISQTPSFKLFLINPT